MKKLTKKYVLDEYKKALLEKNPRNQRHFEAVGASHLKMPIAEFEKVKKSLEVKTIVS